uniref:Uncharacterized protein n=1 Tax=Fagus sylvatica TaxID=28930 RepID=A0A2N9IBS1_FAGSY
MGGAILTSYIGAVCGNRISRSLWHERGLFPSFQAPPSTVSLRTRASKHPIEQPPQPLDRSSLDLQNPERSSSLEAPRALTRHWSSRLSCPRATMSRRHISHSRTRSSRHRNQKVAPPLESSSARSTIWRWNSLHRSEHAPPRVGESVGDNVHALQRRRIFRSPERGLPSSDSRNWHHVRTPQRTIYHLAVETPPSEDSRASTRHRGCRRNSLRASTRGHAAACVRHTRPRSWHTPRPRVASLCHCVSPYRHASVQPLRLLSAKVQDNWQAKNSKSSLIQASVQPLRLPSAKVQDDWQAKNSKSSLTQASVQPPRLPSAEASVQPLRLPSAKVQDDWQAKNSKSSLTQASVQPLRLPSAECLTWSPGPDLGLQCLTWSPRPDLGLQCLTRSSGPDLGLHGLIRSPGPKLGLKGYFWSQEPKSYGNEKRFELIALSEKQVAIAASKHMVEFFDASKLSLPKCKPIQLKRLPPVYGLLKVNIAEASAEEIT